MLFDDTYKTVKTTSEGIFRDKGSKFIGYAFPIQSEADLKPIIAQLKAEHPKARHFCWALRLSPDRAVFRINDDGEPSGTAGRPILNSLLSADLTNVLIVVVRYFGGTLLGVPGLINAYKSASIEAIKENEVITKTINDAYKIEFDYVVMNDVMRIIKEEQLLIIEQNFDSKSIIQIEVRKAQVNKVVAKLEKLEGVKLTYLLIP